MIRNELLSVKQLKQDSRLSIKVIGIGSDAINALNYMIDYGLQGVDFEQFEYNAMFSKSMKKMAV